MAGSSPAMTEGASGDERFGRRQNPKADPSVRSIVVRDRPAIAGISHLMLAPLA
jgi:hypothetical protein